MFKSAYKAKNSSINLTLEKSFASIPKKRKATRCVAFQTKCSWSEPTTKFLHSTTSHYFNQQLSEIVCLKI